MGDDDKKESREDLAVKAGLLLVKKELEEKTGQYSGGNKEKKTINQDEFLKMLRDKKKKALEINFDIFTLKRSYFFSEGIDVQTVIEYVKEKLWDNPKDVSLLNILGTAYMVSGDYSKAEIEYKKGMNIDKYNSDLLYNTSELNIRRGNLREAIENLTLLLKRDKDDFNALYLMSIVFYIRNNNVQASAILAQCLKTDKEAARVHKNFAFLSLIKKNLDKSSEILKKLVEVNVKSIPGRIAYENSCLAIHKYDEYIGEEKILGNVVHGEEGIFSPCINVNRGVFECLNGNYDEAGEYFREALSANNKCLCGLVKYAKMHIMQKKYNEANDILKKAVQLNPSFKPTLIELLRMSFYLKLEPETDEIANKIYNLEKEALIQIYTAEKIFYKIELEKMKDRFFRNMSAILSKFQGEGILFDIISEEDVIIYKLFRDIRLCEIICNGIRE